MLFDWKWLRAEFDDVVETSSFASLKVTINEETISRVFDAVSGGERDRINVALYPLALALAKNWWSLIYEPRKSNEDRSPIEARHSLDAYMNGFVFPMLTLWSGGDDAIAIEHPAIPHRFSNLEFLSNSSAFSTSPRNEIEANLFELVQSVVARLPNGAGSELRFAWDRIRESLGNAEEREYCEASGRLGIDPYDPDSVDVSLFAEGLSKNLFEDICEATNPTEMVEAVRWAKDGVNSLNDFPEIEISGFGTMPTRDPRQRSYVHGYEAARQIRRNLGLDEQSPRRVVDRIFGEAVRADAPALGANHPFSIEAIAGRQNGTMRAAIPATSARQRRSRLCRASYLAWKTSEGDRSAITTGSTLDQQASRAFAAELLAPATWLREKAPPDGLTPEHIETLAEEAVCPEPTIIWQAYNNEIPLRGVALPSTWHPV
jgi:hypothetical protein